MATLEKILISDISTNKYQPRETFDSKEINQLAASIKENGLIQPITVRKDNDGYQLIAGERRLRACKLLQQEYIEANIIEADDIAAAKLAVIENIQREDLSSIEEAKSYKQLLQLTGCTQSQLAESLGKSQSSIANKIRLLSLNYDVIFAIETKQISERHGRALLALDEEKQVKVLKKILKNHLNVKQTEELVEKLTATKKRINKCYGVSTKLVIKSFKDTYKKVKELSQDVKLEESENDDYYIMTISIKK